MLRKSLVIIEPVFAALAVWPAWPDSSTPSRSAASTTASWSGPGAVVI